MTTTTRQPIPQADYADQAAAGRPYPLVPIPAPRDHAAAVAHLQDLRAWWLDAAQGYLTLAENAQRAGDRHAVDEAMGDARQALTNSRRYAPTCRAA